MKTRVLVLGAGFGGLELSTMLAEELGDQVEVTLVDRNDSFAFGYSKLDMMFRGASLESVSLPYSKVVKPGVT
ncbi:MAG: NAD-binding protein, partial [Solirubrobacterales bacterium]|nr:NAD-binding protein [Solirubrobacterales bacterium]